MLVHSFAVEKLLAALTARLSIESMIARVYEARPSEWRQAACMRDLSSGIPASGVLSRNDVYLAVKAAQR